MTMKKIGECNHRDSKGNNCLICDNCPDYAEECNCEDCGAVCPICGEFLGGTCAEEVEKMEEEENNCVFCQHDKEHHPENSEGMNPCKKCGCPEYNLKPISHGTKEAK